MPATADVFANRRLGKKREFHLARSFPSQVQCLSAGCRLKRSGNNDATKKSCFPHAAWQGKKNPPLRAQKDLNTYRFAEKKPLGILPAPPPSPVVHILFPSSVAGVVASHRSPSSGASGNPSAPPGSRWWGSRWSRLKPLRRSKGEREDQRGLQIE